MSMDLLYKQDLGIIYDTITLMIMKLNSRSLWINRISYNDVKLEDEVYVDYWMNQFTDIPQELMIFFYLQDKRETCFFSHVFKKIIQRKKEEVSFEDFVEYIAEGNKIKEDLSEFYLNKKIIDSNVFELELTMKAELNGLVRFYLLGFMVNPDRYLKLLLDTITIYYNKAVEMYKDRADSILKYQEKITGTKLYEIICKYHRNMAKINIDVQDQKMIYTITLLVKNCIVFEIEQPIKWCILGVEYEQQIEEDEKLLIDVAALGNAFGDKHRFNIIQLMLKYGEMSVSDFANRLGLAVNSVSYHLDIMRKANLVCCRTKGKSTIYWLNSKVCAIISDILEKWSRGGDNVEASVEKTHGYSADSLSNE